MTEQQRFEGFASQLNSYRTNLSKKTELKVFKWVKSHDETYNYISEETVNSNGKGCLIVKMNDIRKTYWDLLIIICAVYNCFVIPIDIAFNAPLLDGKFFFILNSVIDILFLVDILVAFRTTYFDTHSGDEVLDGKKTAIAYLKDRFVIDFVSTVPLDTIGEMITHTVNKKLKLFSTLKLVRVTRISRMITRLNVS